MSAPPGPLAESHLSILFEAMIAKNGFNVSIGSFIDLLNKILEPDLNSIRLKKLSLIHI